jgi:thymidylate synthase
LEVGRFEKMKKENGQGLEVRNKFGVVFQDSRGMYMVSPAERKGKLPRVSVIADTFPAAYELALLAVTKYGAESRTHYDQRNSKGKHLFPPSIEAKVAVEVRHPFKEPRMHLFIPGGFEQLESYRQEVVDGIHDAWIKPGDTYWTYTYHERLRNWNPSTDLNASDRGLLLPKGVDQVEKVINDLVRDITSKGAVMTTWMPTADPGLESNRPCLQNIQFRAYTVGGRIKVNMEESFRSRDFKAWFMNCWATSHLGADICVRLSDRVGMPVDFESMEDASISLHAYGDFREELAGFIAKKGLETDKGYRKRVIRTDSNRTDMEQMFQEAIRTERERLAMNPHYALSEDSQDLLAKGLAATLKTNPNAVSIRDAKFVKDFFPQYLN